MTSSLRTHAATTLIALALPATLAAHDFWILPTNFQPAVGSAIGLHLLVGEHFVGERVPRSAAQIERFFVAGPSGEREVAGRDGMDPAGLLRTGCAGHVGRRLPKPPVTRGAGGGRVRAVSEGRRARARDCRTRATRRVVGARPRAILEERQVGPQRRRCRRRHGFQSDTRSHARNRSRTRSSPDRSGWTPDSVALQREAARQCTDRGVPSGRA